MKVVYLRCYRYLFPILKIQGAHPGQCMRPWGRPCCHCTGGGPGPGRAWSEDWTGSGCTPPPTGSGLGCRTSPWTSAAAHSHSGLSAGSLACLGPASTEIDHISIRLNSFFHFINILLTHRCSSVIVVFQAKIICLQEVELLTDLLEQSSSTCFWLKRKNMLFLDVVNRV